ncbi:MAG TPA: threonine/serine dehydratase [Gemmatimonadaceae bacterium]|jgi:threonine dehydratase|nr:threonine/serine dehydratase [Gemmatimonadaceae bacterium]
MPSLSQIEAARARLSGRLHITPTVTATRLGERLGIKLFLKCENLQKTGSFKTRGALNKISQLTPAERDHGVITVSAGNHAQAVAWAARKEGIKATVVMFAAASPAKVDASRGYGADVVLYGESGIQSFAKARELEREHGYTFVHPFDDELVAAGAGTVGLELLEQTESLDAVVVPVGGGGLIAGILPAIKERNPRIRVYGVEPRGASSMRQSLDAGHAVHLQTINTIADGLAAPMAGEMPFEMVKRYADDVVVIDDDAIASAVPELLLNTKLLAETAGAAAMAAILTRAIPVRDGERVAAIVSGGNIDIPKLRGILG